MKSRFYICTISTLLFFSFPLFGQSQPNCFLEDFQPKIAIVPPYKMVDKTALSPRITININSADTLGKVSKYIFGNAVAVWVGQNVNNPTIDGYLKKMAPSLIRFPGGSWSDNYFWSGKPTDIPTQVPDGQNGGKMVNLNPAFASDYSLNLAGYYDLRTKIGAQGLITINYGYARYGLSANPVEKAAHYAADWVRYDNGRTKFWEIGNESAGPWSGGWMIDTSKNKDGQPQIVNGQLYGQHFKIFADSMKAAAKEKNATIYIGGQVIQFDGTTDWNVVNHNWNAGFLKEVGDAADFYVIHNYFGSSSATTIKTEVDLAKNDINANINFVRSDIKNKKAYPKPIALTEWNMTGPDNAKISIANGMQAVAQFGEMIKNNFGMSCRWLVANWNTDGMFYNGDNSALEWQPRPDFYYIYYMNKFTGDHSVSNTVTGSSDILAYSTMFNSGHYGVVVLNNGSKNQVVSIKPSGGVGDKYFIYSLSSVDINEFSPTVVVNGEVPTGTQWGPIEKLETIEAKAYQLGTDIIFECPPRSVQYVLINPGNIIVSVDKEQKIAPSQFELNQNYPNPFNPQTKITYSLEKKSAVSLKVFDILGRLVTTLINNEIKTAGNYEISFNASNYASGVYFYSLYAGGFTFQKKMILVK